MTFAEVFFSPMPHLSAIWWIPPAAVILDRLIGDPPGWPHPVRAIGAALAFVEPRARRRVRNEFAAGLAAALAVLAATYAATRLALALPSLAGAAAATYLAFAGLAFGQLAREGKAALSFLEHGDVQAARQAVGFLVSRDVSQADKEELCRVLAESLSENLNDAFVAPFFWLVAGGPVGLWLYKAASTMDSTWGYMHAPWTRFGSFSARLDDALAFVPARLTAVCIVLAAWRKVPARAMLAAVARDAKTMRSPNAGWPMAAAAWVCGAAMGGRAVYAGKAEEKPILGPRNIAWTPEKLRSLMRLLDIAGYAAATVLYCAAFGFRSIFSA